MTMNMKLISKLFLFVIVAALQLCLIDADCNFEKNAKDSINLLPKRKNFEGADTTKMNFTSWEITSKNDMRKLLEDCDLEGNDTVLEIRLIHWNGTNWELFKE